MIRDFNVEWLRKRIYIPITAFTGMGYGAGGYAGSMGAGNDVLVSVNSTGIAALPFAANTDFVYHAFMTPYDVDRTKAIDFRVHWSNGTTATSIQWILTYALMAAPVNCDLVSTGGTATSPGPTNLGAIPTTSGVATALDTVLPASSSTGANRWEITDYGTLKKNTLTGDSYGLVFKLGITTVTATPSVLGLEMRYTPRRMAGPRRNLIGGRRLQNPLGVQWTQSKQEGL